MPNDSLDVGLTIGSVTVRMRGTGEKQKVCKEKKKKKGEDTYSWRVNFFLSFAFSFSLFAGRELN